MDKGVNRDFFFTLILDLYIVRLYLGVFGKSTITSHRRHSNKLNHFTIYSFPCGQVIMFLAPATRHGHRSVVEGRPCQPKGQHEDKNRIIYRFQHKVFSAFITLFRHKLPSPCRFFLSYFGVLRIHSPLDRLLFLSFCCEVCITSDPRLHGKSCK